MYWFTVSAPLLLLLHLIGANSYCLNTLATMSIKGIRWLDRLVKVCTCCSWVRLVTNSNSAQLLWATRVLSVSTSLISSVVSNLTFNSSPNLTLSFSLHHLSSTWLAYVTFLVFCYCSVTWSERMVVVWFVCFVQSRMFWRSEFIDNSRISYM